MRKAKGPAGAPRGLGSDAKRMKQATLAGFGRPAPEASREVPPPAAPPPAVAPPLQPSNRPSPSAPIQPTPTPGLNAEQRAVVEADGGLLVVHAGPGSGKTRTLVARVAHLVCERKLPPSSLVVLTFSTKATKELRTRLQGALDARTAAQLNIHTFHSLCRRLLLKHAREAHECAGVPTGFGIASERAQAEARAEALERTGHAGRLRDDGAQALIEHCRHADATAAILSAASPGSRAALASALAAASGGSAAGGDGSGGGVLAECDMSPGEMRRVVGAYTAALRARGLLDFEDLVLCATSLLRSPHGAAARAPIEHVLLDEFQDTSAPQCALAVLLSARTRNLTVVGDPDQAIYGWRFACVAGEAVVRALALDWGAAPGASQALATSAGRAPADEGKGGGGGGGGATPAAPAEQRDASVSGCARGSAGARTLRLATNYRSTWPIVAVANAILASEGHGLVARDAKRSSGGREGARVLIVECEGAADEIDALVGFLSEASEAGVAPAEMAVLTRTGRDVRALADALGARGFAAGAGRSALGGRAEARSACALLMAAAAARPERGALKRAVQLCAGVGPSLADTIVDAVPAPHDDPTSAPGACADGALFRRALKNAPLRLPAGGGAKAVTTRRELSRFAAEVAALTQLAHGGAPVDQMLSAVYSGALGALLVSGASAAAAKAAEAPAAGDAAGASAAGAAEGEGSSTRSALVELAREQAGALCEGDDAATQADARVRAFAEAVGVSFTSEGGAPAPRVEGASGAHAPAALGPGEVAPQRVAGGITVMTIHQAKGLEWSAVAIAGVEDGTIPHALSGCTPAGRAEERRLLYVGATRAKARLVLTHTGARSPFLRSLPAEHVEYRVVLERPSVGAGGPSQVPGQHHDAMAPGAPGAAHGRAPCGGTSHSQGPVVQFSRRAGKGPQSAAAAGARSFNGGGFSAAATGGFCTAASMLAKGRAPLGQGAADGGTRQ